MAATAQSQHRCVFVGNIPYDATEEQLVQICEEVGPVVSFRLVTDRETGKPKGYGFCEYKDEETALSARRNLQGYEINGRQLRVDFAENDKNSDRNRSEQGRGGPGTVPNVGPGHQNFNLPMGDSVSMAAATVMAGALGSAQTASMRNQIGLQSQPLMGTDPLTRHLAKLSRTQLAEVISELKAMATQDKERARNLLLAIPNLPKAIFQAEIMLGLVSQQMLMMPNIRQTSAQPVVQPMVQSVQTLSGLPPLPQNKVPSLQPCAQDSRVSTGVPIQYAEQFPAQVQTQRLPLMQNQVQQGQLQVQAVQHSLAQSPSAVSPLKSGYNDQSRYPIAGTMMHPHLSAAGIQEKVDLQGHNASVHGKRVLSHSIDQMDRASKLMKLNEGRVSPLQTSAQPSILLPMSGVQTKQESRVEAVVPEKQATQIQLPAYLNTAAVRQQVLNLASEQLDSLTPDQLQQLFQLQQMLRQAT